MMNKELIELQKGCEATGVIIQNDDIEKLEEKVLIHADCRDDELLQTFQEKLSKVEETLIYFVIEEVDAIEIEKQERFYQIVKDREFCGYTIPKDVIIILTVRNKESLKNMSQELYHLCIVAF